ncbi:unnamed protein product [Cochlearia groenlandica]
MNATKFVMLMIFIGVVCANIGARKLDGLPKDTELSMISVSKLVNTNGLGVELSEVIVESSAYHSSTDYAEADGRGPGGPEAGAVGSTYESTNGYVRAVGPNARGSSSSNAYGEGRANAAANGTDATADGTGYGGAGSYAEGQTGNP